MNKFQKDLQTGQHYERLLLKHIPHKSYEIMEGYFPAYDLIVHKKNGLSSTYEVKSDKQINIYGNICIEFENNNKPSGISKSYAKYWAIFEAVKDKYRLYKIPRKVILNMIEKCKYKYIKYGGDNMLSKLYLFDKKIFNKYIIYSDIDE